MNHKRSRARNRRAGCKFCKPWKINGYRTERLGGERFSDHRRRNAAEAFWYGVDGERPGRCAATANDIPESES